MTTPTNSGKADDLIDAVRSGSLTPGQAARVVASLQLGDEAMKRLTTQSEAVATLTRERDALIESIESANKRLLAVVLPATGVEGQSAKTREEVSKSNIRPLTDDEIHDLSCEISHDVRSGAGEVEGLDRVRWNNRAVGCLVRTVNDLQAQLLAATAAEGRMREQFQLETLRTSEGYRLLRRAADLVKDRWHCPHAVNPGACCELVNDIESLLARPINDDQAHAALATHPASPLGIPVAVDPTLEPPSASNVPKSGAQLAWDEVIAEMKPTHPVSPADPTPPAAEGEVRNGK